MIPRFKPAIGRAELLATTRSSAGAVPRFERAFARQFGASDGVAFAYGRSALYALCKALALEGAEVIMPAYTCSVVAHAVTLSGNTCRFVDITLDDYNMDLAQVEAALNERTAIVVATHLFGFPLDVDRLAALVGDAERRFGRRIVVVQDCAHAFGATWNGRLVSASADMALFGLNISKMMTSIFGGMMTSNDAALVARLRSWRDEHVRQPSSLKSIQRRAYLWAAAGAFTGPMYGAVQWLQRETPLLDSLAKAYHLDDVIALPPDFLDPMLAVEAEVGLAQLARYPEIERQRVENARFYHDHLAAPSDWVLPPLVGGATYSHFPVRVPDRAAALRAFLGAGIEAGEVIEYSVPHLTGYPAAGDPSAFPNSWLCSRHVINLPVHPGLSSRDRDRVVDRVAHQTASARSAARSIDAGRGGAAAPSGRPA